MTAESSPEGGPVDVPSESPPVRVLYVEDDTDFAQLAKTRIEEAFDHVRVATEAKPARGLERLRTERFDCLVTDYRMEGMDGIDVVRRVREFDEEIPVIFFTGVGSEEIASDAISAGVTDYLRKEGSKQTFVVLGNRIVRLVERQRAREEAERRRREVIAVYDRIRSAFVGLDDDWRFTYLNGAAERLLDVPEAQVRGRRIWEVFPEFLETAFETGLREAVEEVEPAAFEAEIPERDQWLSVWAYPDENGVSLFIEDVTEQKQAEVELSELRKEVDLSERKFRALKQKLSRPEPPFRH